MGRKAKPIDLIVMGGKSHKTKSEIIARKEREIHPNTDSVKCPNWLCDVAKEEWNRIEKDLIELGLLTNIDVNQLAIYCDSYAKYIKASQEIEKNGLVVEHTNKMGATNLVTNPYVQIATKYAELVKKFCSEFGLTPSSRAKIAIPKIENDSNDKENRIRGLI